MAKGRGREEENERYVCDVLGIRKIDKNHMKPPKKKLLWLLRNNIRLSKRLRLTKMLNFIRKPQSKCFSNGSIDGKAFSLNFYYTIRDRFHIWFYCNPFESLLLARRNSEYVNWLENVFSLLCNVMSFGSGRERKKSTLGKVSFILIIVIIWLIECQWGLNAELS